MFGSSKIINQERRLTLIGLRLLFLLTFMSSNGALAQNTSTLPENLRILGGSQFNPSDSPVALILGTNSKGQKYKCSGVLVDRQAVLTSAHCVIPNFTLMISIAKTQTHATLAYVNGSFDSNNNSITAANSDLALLILNEPVLSIEPVRVLSDLPVSSGLAFAVFGFGANETSGATEFASLNNARYGLIEVTAATDGVFYSFVNDNSASTCAGDSGGPALTKVGNHYALIGLTSRGTNLLDADRNCELSQGGLSVFTDLTAPGSAEFLGTFSEIQKLSGPNALLEYTAQRLLSKIDLIQSNNVPKLNSNTLSTQIKELKKLQKTVSGLRSKLVRRVIKSLTDLRRNSQRAKAKKQIARTKAILIKITSLGLN
jgi:hypothetical protein